MLDQPIQHLVDVVILLGRNREQSNFSAFDDVQSPGNKITRQTKYYLHKFDEFFGGDALCKIVLVSQHK